MNLLIDKLNKYGYKDLLNKNYLSYLTNDEINKILYLNNSDFKKYFSIVRKLYLKNIFNTRELEINTIKILDIIFSNINKKNKDLALDLISNTKFLQTNNYMDAIILFLSLENKNKALVVVDIFYNIDYPYMIDASKIVNNIKVCENNNQLNTLFFIFSNTSNLKNKRISTVVNLIIRNPKYKYYKYIIDLINKHDFLVSNKELDIIKRLIKLDDEDQIKLIYNSVTTPEMYNNAICVPFINSIFKNGSKSYYKYYNKLVINKEKIPDSIFKKMLEVIKLSDKEFKIYGVLELIDSNFIKNLNKMDILLDAISNSKYEFQVEGLLRLNSQKRYLERTEYFKEIVYGIINCEKDYQVKTIVSVIRKIVNSDYYKEIIDAIIDSSIINSYYIREFIDNDLSYRKDYMYLFNRLIKLDKEYQKEVFVSIIDKEDLKNRDLNDILNMIERCKNKYQSYALLELLDNGIYNNEHFNLVKYLFTSKDKRYINLYKNILLRINKLGYYKAFWLISFIHDSGISINMIYDLINNYLDSEAFINDSDFEDFCQDEVKKMLVLKNSK